MSGLAKYFKYLRKILMITNSNFWRVGNPKIWEKAQACITVKYTIDNNKHLVYSLEGMDIENALEKMRAKGQDL